MCNSYCKPDEGIHYYVDFWPHECPEPDAIGTTLAFRANRGHGAQVIEEHGLEPMVWYVVIAQNPAPEAPRPHGVPQHAKATLFGLKDPNYE